jgi:uncharacterized protein (TIGR03382 family)
VNPSTTDQVRLFFSSPGPKTFGQLPVSTGKDVWPFFGSNTSNYVEIAFDDGLDGQYGGLWHMNESVTQTGLIDVTRSPDVSGYFNTAVVKGAVDFPGPNNGVLGKAAVMNGGYLEVADDPSLEPTNGITMEMTIRPAGDPDCDAGNNFRVLMRKGEAYSLVFEETRGVRARVRVAGGAVRGVYSGAVMPADGVTWTKVTAEYDAPTGRFQIRFNDTVVAEQTFAPAPLEGTGDPLRIGGNGNAPVCPIGGNFAGAIDEVSVSRIARHIQTPVDPDGPGGAPDGNPGNGNNDAGPGGGDPSSPGCCDSGRGAAGSFTLTLLVLVVLRRRRR